MQEMGEIVRSLIAALRRRSNLSLHLGRLMFLRGDQAQPFFGGATFR